MLKKIAVSICAAGLLLAGASAYAATSNLVGQKVQGLFSIKKDGVKIADAVIINGTAYAPVRAVSEAAGASLTVEGKEIIMDSQPNTVTTNNTAKIEQLKGLKSIVENNIKVTTAEINMYETDVIPRAEEAYQNSIGGVEEAGRKKWLESMKANYEQAKEKLTSLNAELQNYDAQIIELQ